MEKFEVEVNLNHLRDARAALNSGVADFNAGFDRALKRLIYEAARNMMSAQEVGKMAGMSTAAVKAKMKKFDLNPSKGRSLLSKQAAAVLASNAELLGIEPHQIDLMSPLAYLPAGKDLFLETPRSHVTDLAEPLVHIVNHWDDEIACGADSLSEPILVCDDPEKVTCQDCRGVLIEGPAS